MKSLHVLFFYVAEPIGCIRSKVEFSSRLEIELALIDLRFLEENPVDSLSVLNYEEVDLHP